MTTAPATEIDGLFQSELQAVNEDVRRQAALAAFQKLRPGNHVTVEQFLAGVQSHKDLWAVVGPLGIVDFAEVLAGYRAPIAAKPRQRRTRISEEKKGSLKEAILRIFDGNTAGMSRIEATATIIARGLAPQGIERATLPEKVRQPLRELVAEGKLHTVGEKRLMKYMPGLGSKKAK